MLGYNSIIDRGLFFFNIYLRFIYWIINKESKLIYSGVIFVIITFFPILFYFDIFYNLLLSTVGLLIIDLTFNQFLRKKIYNYKDKQKQNDKDRKKAQYFILEIKNKVNRTKKEKLIYILDQMRSKVKGVFKRKDKDENTDRIELSLKQNLSGNKIKLKIKLKYIYFFNFVIFLYFYINIKNVLFRNQHHDVRLNSFDFMYSTPSLYVSNNNIISWLVKRSLNNLLYPTINLLFSNIWSFLIIPLFNFIIQLTLSCIFG